ncbi:S8 family serine peptidase [Synechococcus sp. MIT S1220]|uniref:S8 family serine peptidase n=1 Tax=Synechococcus sp. MIT S1220 TaxID=3082549 RepID=UPI0039B05133
MTIVAIVDSGLNLKHRDISPNLWVNSGEIPNNGIDDDGNGAIDDIHGLDTFSSAGLATTLSNSGDPQGHGTHVAGIVARLAPKAELMPVRMLDEQGNGVLSDALFAWSYALENGAKVINNSFGVVGLPTSEFSFMEEAVRLGKSGYGAVFIAAAGNQGNDNDVVPCTPANVPGMISVGATSAGGDAASFSNYGKKSVHLFAPGENILSADAFSVSARSRKSGTSQAAPIVSAYVAKIYAKKPKSKPSFVEKQLFSQIKGSTLLAGKSKSGGALAAVHTRKINSVASPRYARRAERQASDPLINYQRLVGVVNQSSGITQHDVNEQLLCKGYKFIDDIVWPFDNVAVISLDSSSKEFVASQRDTGALSRVLDMPWSAKKSLKRVKRLGFFETLEWDAFVTQQASPDHSFALGSHDQSPLALIGEAQVELGSV